MRSTAFLGWGLTASLVLAMHALPADSQAAEPNAPAPLRQYVYVLRLPERLHQQSAWTPADQQAVGQHFDRLKRATEAGQVILAGRSSEGLDKTFGLVIFEAASEDEARAFMQGDPAVAAGVMNATLHPYSVALMRR